MTANPLGAKAGIHKLGITADYSYNNFGQLCLMIVQGVFYYVLGNVRPLYRSSIRAIQLLAVAKTSDLRLNGCDAILQPFINQVNELGTVS